MSDISEAYLENKNGQVKRQRSWVKTLWAFLSGGSKPRVKEEAKRDQAVTGTAGSPALPQSGGKAVGAISEAYRNNKVGPVMRQGSLARAVAEAAGYDNPDKTIHVEDKVAYIRIETDGEMILRRDTIEEMLGRPFSMNELEVELSSFAGRIDTQEDLVRFYYKTHL